LVVRRLRDFQIVGLDLSGAVSTCRVVAVDGEQAVLEPRAAGDVAARTLPSAATLSFDTPRHPVLLAGAADAGPVAGTLRFWITDAVGVAPVRLRPRLKAELAVRVTPTDEDGRRIAFGQDYATTDVSAGGLAITGLVALPGAPLRVELVVPGMVRIVSSRARVVRRVAGGATAVAFEGLEPELAARLDELIFTVRRRVARQAFLLHEPAA
jgi:hypothetical protein